MKEKVEFFKFHCMKRGRLFYKRTNTKTLILAVDKKTLGVTKATYLHDLPMHRSTKIDENEWIKELSLFMKQIQ